MNSNTEQFNKDVKKGKRLEKMAMESFRREGRFCDDVSEEYLQADFVIDNNGMLIFADSKSMLGRTITIEYDHPRRVAWFKSKYTEKYFFVDEATKQIKTYYKDELDSYIGFSDHIRTHVKENKKLAKHLHLVTRPSVNKDGYTIYSIDTNRLDEYLRAEWGRCA